MVLMTHIASLGRLYCIDLNSRLPIALSNADCTAAACISSATFLLRYLPLQVVA